MLTVDLQPASIVEDKGSVNFVHVLDPKYQIPSRRTIMRRHLPDLYEASKQCLLAELSQAKYCALHPIFGQLRDT